MNQTAFYTKRPMLWHKKLSGFILIALLLLSGSAQAQTIEVGANKYAFDGAVNAIVKDAAGNTYFGGAFTSVGLWSGSGAQFNRSTGVQNTAFAKVAGGEILAVVPIPSGGWYIGGLFTAVDGITRNRLARINADGTLHAFDPNMNGAVLALVLDGSNLYAGGAFTTVGGSTTRNRLCKFDNTGALTAFNPNMSNTVQALASNGSGNLYAGGDFTIVGGGTTRNYLCKFSSSGVLDAWNPNINSPVYALAFDGGNLYAGGAFTRVGGSTTRNRLCKFDNTGALTTFNPNMGGIVYDLAIDGSGNLYAGGGFQTIGGSTTRNRLCKFDNTGALTAFNPNMVGVVYALALDGSGNLYAGGGFTTVGGSTTRNRLCQFDNTGALTAFDPNINGAVNALALDGSGNLYAGGGFTTVGSSTTRNRLCQFDNTGALTAFDPNINGAVLALVLDGGNLYAGGAFTTVGGSTTRNYLCKFDNTGALTAFNPNMSNTVQALASNGSGNLYAGGDFTIVGGSTTRNYLCKFSSSGVLDAWNPSMSSTVNALALDGGNLYAGGAFTTVGGITTRNRLCKFDNAGALTAFDPNINNTVNALAVDGGNLYAGGAFTTVGGSSTRNRLCKFANTGALTAFNPNMNSSVRALAPDGSGNLYAGGDFTTVGGTTRNYLCRFDNSGVLTAFNPNINGSVNALALDGSGNLYAGGVFTTPAPYLAIYSNPCAAPSAYNMTGGGAYCSGGAGVPIGLVSSEAGVTYQLRNGISNVGNAVNGNGSAISFGNQTAVATYTVLATRTTGGCTTTMTGNKTVTINPLPTAYSLLGSNSVSIALSDSETGVEYQLLNGVTNVGSSIAGVGASLSFGVHRVPGTYTVLATRLTGCTASMTGSITITPSPFVTRWNLAELGREATELSFGVETSDTVMYTWTTVPAGTSGSGRFTGTTANITGLPAGAIIDLSIAPANFSRINIGLVDDRRRLIGIQQWGDVVWSSMSTAFYDCSNMELNATDAPILVNVRDMSYMFGYCTAFNQALPNGFNTVNVTNMNGMFESCTAYNQPLPSSFNTVNVTTTHGMFDNCSSFNQALPSSFNTTNVTMMVLMFHNCSSYNQPLPSSFNTVNVTNMALMFNGCSAYNQVLPNSFSTVNVTDMGYMFFNCSSYNQPFPSSFSTVNVTDMTYMFYNCSSYDQNIGNLNISRASNMSDIFNNSGISPSNYDAILIAWNAAGYTNKDLGNASPLRYCAGEAARTALTSTKGWSITGDVSATPTAFNVTGGGAYCAGGAGVSIGLVSSETSVTYQLRNGAGNVGSAVSGTGSAVSFGNQTVAGTYTVLATRTTSGCTATMTGSATVTVNQPIQASITASNGLSFCPGAITILTAIPSGISFTWNTSASTQVITVNSAGTFSATVTDTNGCTSVAIATTTVTDTQAPVIVCPVNQSLTATGTATLPSYTSMATVTDDCGGGVSVTQMPAPGTVYTANGMVNVTLTAMDASANTAVCAFDVNVTVVPGQAYTTGGELPCNYRTLTSLGAVPASNGGSTSCYSVFGNNIGVSALNVLPDGSVPGDKGVFYTFRMPSCGTTPGVRISTNNAGTSMFGTSVAVYTVTNPGSCAYATYQLVGRNSTSFVVGCSGSSSSMDHGTLEFGPGTLISGGSYYIYVCGDRGTQGDFELTFEYLQSAGISVTAGATPGQAEVTMPDNGQTQSKVQWRPVGSTGWATSALLTGFSYTLPTNSLMPGVPYEFRALYQCAGTNWVLMSSDIVNFATVPTVTTCSAVSGLTCNSISGSVTTTWSTVPVGTSSRVTVALRNGSSLLAGSTVASTVTSVVFANRPTATSMQVQSNCGGAAYIAYSTCAFSAAGQAAAVQSVTFGYNGITYEGIDFNDPQWGLFGAQPEGDFTMSVANGQLIITDESVKASGFDFELRPSVAIDFTNVVISTEKAVDAQLSLNDMNGTLVSSQMLKGVQNGTIVTLETSELPAGLYIVSVRTEEGNVAKKLVVVK